MSLAFYGLQFVFMLALLVFSGSVIDILSSKVPLKSANYDIQWSTIEYQQGTEGSPSTLRFDMWIFNHHESLGLEVENAILLFNLEERYLSEASLTIPCVAPGASVVVPAELALRLDFYELAGIASEESFSFFHREEPAWREKLQARLMVRLLLELRLPLPISAGYRHQFQERQRRVGRGKQRGSNMVASLCRLNRLFSFISCAILLTDSGKLPPGLGPQLIVSKGAFVS